MVILCKIYKLRLIIFNKLFAKIKIQRFAVFNVISLKVISTERSRPSGRSMFDLVLRF